MCEISLDARLSQPDVMINYDTHRVIYADTGSTKECSREGHRIQKRMFLVECHIDDFLNLIDVNVLGFRIDEIPDDKWDLPRVVVDALGAAMLVTIILDLWRIFLGPIVHIPNTNQCLQPALPWLPEYAI